MKRTRPRAIDFLVLAIGLFSFCASSRVSLAGASPETRSTLPQAMSAIAIDLLTSNSGKLLYYGAGSCCRGRSPPLVTIRIYTVPETVAGKRSLCFAARVGGRNRFLGALYRVFRQLFPVRRKNIELVRRLRALVGGEHDGLPIRRELRKRREPAEICHLLQVRPVRIDQIQLKFPPIAIVLVGGKQNLLTVRRKRWSKTGASEIRDLLRILTLAVRHEQFHFHRRCQVFAQQVVIALFGFGRQRMIRAPHQLFAIAGKYRSPVVTVGFG